MLRHIAGRHRAVIPSISLYANRNHHSVTLWLYCAGKISLAPSNSIDRIFAPNSFAADWGKPCLACWVRSCLLAVGVRWHMLTVVLFGRKQTPERHKQPVLMCLSQVLKEIVDMGHASSDLKLVRKPSVLEEAEEVEDEVEERTTVSFLKKKKKLLTSFQNSFFSGCTPISEESWAGSEPGPVGMEGVNMCLSSVCPSVCCDL